MQCLVCQKDLSKTQNYFCSRSCYNNFTTRLSKMTIEEKRQRKLALEIESQEIKKVYSEKFCRRFEEVDREDFMWWLQENKPDMLCDYRELYTT